MKEKKPRKTEVLIDLGQVQVISGMKIGQDGLFTIYGPLGESIAPHHVQLGTAYDRASKQPKVIVRSAGEPGSMQTDPNRLLAEFDFVVAVDTNTKTIRGVQVSITAAVLVRDIEIGGGQWRAGLIPQGALEFHDATEPPEIVGWCEVIRMLEASPQISGRVALVVDHDLRRHAVWNARREPLIGDFYLPQNMQLVYASAERGSQEFIAAAAIGECERTAKRLLQRVRKGGIAAPPGRVEGKPYRAGRVWQPPGKAKVG